MNNINQSLGNYIELSNKLEASLKNVQDMRKQKKKMEESLLRIYDHKDNKTLSYRNFEVELKTQKQYKSITQDHIKMSLYKYFTHKGYSNEKSQKYTNEISNFILKTRSKTHKKILHIKKDAS